MNSSRAWSAAFAVLLVLLPAAPGWPQTPPPAETPERAAEARKSFELGLRLYQDGSPREALAAFSHAHRLSPRARILRNIAQCHRDLKDFANAHQSYDDLLHTYEAELSAQEVEDVRRALRELLALTGLLKVRIAEPGATIQLDGVPLARADQRVNVGTYEIRATKPGFLPLRRTVVVAGGEEVTIDEPMQPEVLTGRLRVSTGETAGAEILIDGIPVGPAPWEGDLPPGPHSIEARSATSAAKPRRVDLRQGARAEVVLELSALAGRLSIDTRSANASIAIDGRHVGRGAWQGDLPVGPHQIVVSRDGFETHERRVVVRAGEALDAEVVLRPLAAPPDDRGMVGRLQGGLAIGAAAPGGSFSDGCPTNVGGACDADAPVGAILDLRVGYTFGYFGLEGFLLARYDRFEATTTFEREVPRGEYFGPPRTQESEIQRFGGGAGIGARGSTRHELIRATGGAAFGVLALAGQSSQRVEHATNERRFQVFSTDVAGQAAPTLLFDLAAVIGPRDSAKVVLGALAQVIFSGDGILTSNRAERTLGGGDRYGAPPYQVSGGVEAFVGPLLGVQFGP